MPHSYDSAWSKWPVKHGHVWRVGEHVIACGDHEHHAADVLIERFPEQPVMTYVDPPWTPALASGYRTKAGVPHRVDFPGLLRRVLRAACWASGAIWIESGVQHEQAMLEAGSHADLERLASWETTYYKTRPARLHLFKHAGAPLDVGTMDFTGMDDEDTPAVAITATSRPGDLVFDPCTGQGLTAETAAMMGRRFIGIELHPGRMARALDRVAAVGGETPRFERWL
jgi:hypothetical protein